jgi:hypothetical protein
MANPTDLPAFYRLTRKPADRTGLDPAAMTARVVEPLLDRIDPGARVAVAVGSRGIADLPEVVRAVVEALTAHGCRPFLFPAMGSHGGATAQGQRALLGKVGIDAEALGVTIESDMDTVSLGRTDSGLDVRFDGHAHAADATLLINRVKPHTDFIGRIGSGMIKMAVIGCGKRQGAEMVHREAKTRGYESVLMEVGRFVLDKSNIVGGVALVEGFDHRVVRVEGLAADTIVDREPALLAEATRSMARLPVEALDLLIVDEIGKDISGVCMDPNVIGRNVIRGDQEAWRRGPVRRIYARSMTEAGYGNALGVGLADFVSRRLLDAIDEEATLANALTSGNVELIRRPAVIGSDHDTIHAAIGTARPVAPADARILWIRNTLDLSPVYVSQSLAQECRALQEYTLDDRAIELPFDKKGDLPGFDEV